MSHFAEIDPDTGIVLRVIVAEQDFIDSGTVGDPSNWIQTSYNTIQGVHKLDGTPLRKNFAGIGYKYDKILDGFIPPKSFDSWTLDQKKCVFVAPIEMPKDGKLYSWNEEIKNWVEVKEILNNSNNK